MGITLPISAVNTSNVDLGTDRPDLARADIYDAMQKLNQVLANLSAIVAAGAIVVRDSSGNIAGNVTGSSASCTGNAATASACSGNSATATVATNSAGTGSIPKTVENGLRVVRGSIATSGGVTSISRGSGFTVTRTGTGVWSITFTAAFSDVPTFVVSSNYQANFTVAGGAGAGNTATVKAYNTSGAAVDINFEFIAIGLN